MMQFSRESPHNTLRPPDDPPKPPATTSKTMPDYYTQTRKTRVPPQCAERHDLGH